MRTWCACGSAPDQISADMCNALSWQMFAQIINKHPFAVTFATLALQARWQLRPSASGFLHMCVCSCVAHEMNELPRTTTIYAAGHPMQWCALRMLAINTKSLRVHCEFSSFVCIRKGTSARKKCKKEGGDHVPFWKRLHKWLSHRAIRILINKNVSNAFYTLLQTLFILIA